MEQRVSISIADGIADVRLVRADKMNALDAAMFDALVAATARLAQEKGVRAVVLSGEGRAFCAGLDMGRFAAMKESGGNGIAGGERRDLSARTHGLANYPQQAVWGWRQLPVPVIAAIQGVAFGGGFQLALGADMRFLAPDARMSIMEIKWGLVPDMAGTPILASSRPRRYFARADLHRAHLLRAGSPELRPCDARLRRSTRCGLRTRARDREQEPRCDPRLQAHAQQSIRQSRSGTACGVRRADEVDGLAQSARGCARQYREARAAVCGGGLRTRTSS